MKRYRIDDNDLELYRLKVSSTAVRLWEDDLLAARVELRADAEGNITPESARRLRVLAAAPEMEELLRLFAKEEENFTCDCTGCKMRRRILRYIETGEEA